MIIIGLLAAVVNHATNKKNLPESSSHLQLYRFDKKAINNLAWCCSDNKTRSILHCSKNEKENNFTQGADFYILKGGILQFNFFGAMSIFNAPRL